MTTYSIEIKNLDKLKAAMGQAPGMVVNETDKAIKKSIFQLAGTSARMAPIQTGTLRGSILSGTSFGRLTGRIVPWVNYAIYVHEGTSRWPISMPSRTGERRFFEKSIKQEQGNIDGFFKEALDNVTNEISRRSK